jgi:DNA-binding LacI/PurR family transcriptional regulator
MERLLGLSHPPTAVFCFNDVTAAGALLAASDANLHVPYDLSVVGFDDSRIASYLVPPLTTVAQQKDKMAQLALQMALSLLGAGEPLTSTILPGKLVVRESTAPYRS